MADAIGQLGAGITCPRAGLLIAPPAGASISSHESTPAEPMRTNRFLRLALSRPLRQPLHKPSLRPRAARRLPQPPSPLALPSRIVAFSTTAVAMSKFYELKTELPNGKTYDFAQLKGKVVLIVNVASKWYALSPSFLASSVSPCCAAVSHLSTRVSRACTTSTRRRALSSSASPATRYVSLVTPTRACETQGETQFGGQEPGSDEEIASFCELNHGVSFPLMKKTDVNGDHTNEVYKYLKAEKSGILGLTRIKVRFSPFACHAGLTNSFAVEL